MLVEHPEPHRPFSAGAGFGQFLRQRGLEGLRLRRVFFGVGLARHLQDPAGFSQQRIDARQRQPALGARLDPRLRVLRAAELPVAQLREESLAIGTGQRRLPAALVLALQQCRDAAGEERVEVTEYRAPAHIRRHRDLLGIEGVLRHQSDHPQALASPLTGGLLPRRFQLHHSGRP